MTQDAGRDPAASLGSMANGRPLTKGEIEESLRMSREREDVSLRHYDESLRDELDGCEHRWIPVTVRMPEHCQVVLVAGPEIAYCERAWVYERREPWHDHYGVKYEPNSVTHWMPLPPRPDMGSDGPNMGSEMGSK